MIKIIWTRKDIAKTRMQSLRKIVPIEFALEKSLIG
jgi:hypothetical protein